MDFYNKTKQFMTDVFTKANDPMGVKHHERVDSLEVKSENNSLFRTLINSAQG